MTEGSDSGALKSITEVAGDLGVPSYVLRFWEKQFSGIVPLKGAGGRRYYTPAVVERLRRIHGLVYGQNMKPQDAATVLDASPAPAPPEPEPVLVMEITAAEPFPASPPESAEAQPEPLVLAVEITAADSSPAEEARAAPPEPLVLAVEITAAEPFPATPPESAETPPEPLVLAMEITAADSSPAEEARAEPPEVFVLAVEGDAARLLSAPESPAALLAYAPERQAPPARGRAELDDCADCGQPADPSARALLRERLGEIRAELLALRADLAAAAATL
ncbi:hypothetical protein FACS1894186_1390 [Alphaproteobacteria bacterium]|nr:hypothetical protein FACS1894186_1390 [Alphaproteobacteria bacterium]